MAKRKYEQYQLVAENGTDEFYDDYREVFADFQSLKKSGLSATMYGISDIGDNEVIMSC